MKKLTTFFFKPVANFFVYFLLSFTTHAQVDIPVGTWRTHISYNSQRHVVLAKQKVFSAGSYSLMFFDNEDNSINKLTKIDGFSDVDISTLNYFEDIGTMVIGYDNGNIDLVKNETIVNIKGIRDAPISGSKRINSVSLVNSMAYLSTDFGLVVLNLINNEIREIYGNIGRQASRIAVYSSVVLRDSIYIATQQGIMSGSLHGQVNLMDFNNWKRFGEEDDLLGEPISSMAIFDNEIFAGIDNIGIYVYDQNSWQPTSLTINEPVVSLNTSNNMLLISSASQLYISSQKNVFHQIEDPLISKPGNAVFDNNGKLWIADQTHGLISNKEGIFFRAYFPEGPMSNEISKLLHFKNKIIGLAGGFDKSFDPKENAGTFSVFESGKWQNFTPLLSGFPEVKDLSGGAYRSSNNKTYFSSFGSGVLEWDQENNFQIFNSENSSLQNSGNDLSKTLVTDVAIDQNNSLWFANYGVAGSLHKLDQNEQWQSFSFGTLNTRYPLGITIVSNGDKWVRLSTSGGSEILVFNEEKNQNRILGTSNNSGALPGNRVTEVTEDHLGQVWVGTDQGIALFLDPYSVLDNSGINAVIPRYENGMLLRGEHITSIKADGGNRKWIGTTNGLWLFDEAGEVLIHNFHVGNSPLPSNHIFDIEINEPSGEVFIATDKGLVSYRGTASRGTIQHQSVKIFPNPVKGSFAGLLGISGLTYNANVKITDIGGRLVRQLYANGGTAVWDINDNKGKRVSSGIYLVLSASEDGEETFVGKIAVIE